MVIQYYRELKTSLRVYVFKKPVFLLAYSEPIQSVYLLIVQLLLFIIVKR